MKKIVFEKTTINEHGEVLEQEFVKTQEQEPNFVKIYLNTVLATKNLSVVTSPILHNLLELTSYADSKHMLYLTGHLKNEICLKHGIKIKRLDQIIKSFCEQELFKKLGRGTYVLNPYFFGKGHWKDIKKVRIEFDMIKSNIEFETEND